MVRRLSRFLLWIGLGLVVLCLAAAAVSTVINRSLPVHSMAAGGLTDADLARLEEAQHLRKTLGESVWSGWGNVDIPMILYDEQYAFLTGIDQPASGWVKVPETGLRGAAWERVPGVTFDNNPVYRQAVANADQIIGAFTVNVGDRWVACLGTRDWSKISFYQGFREQIPAVLRGVFPYPLAWQLLMGQTDRYEVSLLHESFHAYQGMLNPQKLIAAELSTHQEQNYPWDATQAAWQAELNTLTGAVLSGSHPEQIELARHFLQIRQERRAAAGLSQQMIDYERQREWLEGLAKYAELSIGLAAANSPDYQPVGALASLDGDFQGYSEYRTFYREQLTEVGRLSGRSEETRFYYSGMAQAVLLDSLNPGWKPLAMQDGVYLEDILADTLKKIQ